MVAHGPLFLFPLLLMSGFGDLSYPWVLGGGVGGGVFWERAYLPWCREG